MKGKFRVVVDEIDYHGSLKNVPQFFEVEAPDEDTLWNMAETMARKLSTDFKVHEFTLMRMDV